MTKCKYYKYFFSNPFKSIPVCCHIAWKGNRYNHCSVPELKCNGDKNTCDLLQARDFKDYMAGLKRRIINTEKKIQKLKQELEEFEKFRDGKNKILKDK